MYIKLIIILSILIGISKPQFVDVEIEFDLRAVKKEHHYTLNEFKDLIENYFKNTVFSEKDIDLNIPLNIYIIVESISQNNNLRIINAQFIISNNLDMNFISRTAAIPYYRGKSISLSTEFDPMSSLLDYFAYMFLGNELDMYSSLGGNSFFNLAEKISIHGRDSDYSNGWNDRWKKCKRIIKNGHLRNFRYHWYELSYLLGSEEKDKDKIIEKLLAELENDIYYLQEFFPNDRNAFLFLDIYAPEIAELFGKMKLFDSLALLSNYDADNRSIYSSFIK